MPTDHTLYPEGWSITRAYILGRAWNQCECTGECGLHQPNPMPRRCCEMNHTPARWFNGQVKLAIAHLCSCTPLCKNLDHLKAMCQRCHLRLDRFDHAAKRLRTQGLNPKKPPILRP